MSLTELEARTAEVTGAISSAKPGVRHLHLDALHGLVSEYALTGNGIPARLRQLQEELTNEAIEARFDNLPI
ncbi:hypothetical protein GLS40_07865 [Pseudooceanicola sp. 216_PA32_1]|uniref:Uncharacterized protein n=1 Tax=Pseudooceanicola pacificus TaxID=2676438 RepID=A0A844W4E0_9RHOB|nr:hypothetical protein [Pseudooceanicola pacificus]MWB77935.1 hypothetical protein [Pseudooceanicola pacificus]